MGAVAEEKTPSAVRTTQRVLGESRPNKIIKKNREKKALKGLDVDAVIEAAESRSPESEDTQDGKEKKSQGIVIDGRTYTCATCKTGHRVGICKHARERPMTATHPPGRPPAGAPKKVICDCPKECSCKKRDCKCPRNCSCTQMMYMLVYVPAPGEQEDTDEEKGTWKLGEQVTTDLKGNILSPEQVKERQEQKEAQKTQTPEKRVAGLSKIPVNELGKDTSSNTEHKPKAEGGCCKHKENIATEKVMKETSLQPVTISNSLSKGCNCGHSCACTFCPQHPNNPASRNMARQQAMHFANEPSHHNGQPIVPFAPAPAFPQRSSCMGPPPQYAMYRSSQRPSYQDMQQAFPDSRGILMAYPIQTSRLDSSGLAMAPFPLHSTLGPHMDIIHSNGINTIQGSVSASHIGPVQPELPTYDYTPDEFDIGNAFVASAGPEGWNDAFLSPETWAMETSVTTPVNSNFAESTSFLGPPSVLAESSVISMSGQPNLSLSSTLHGPEHDHFFGFVASSPALQSIEMQQHFHPTISSYGMPQVSGVSLNNHSIPHSYSSPTKENDSPAIVQPDG